MTALPDAAIHHMLGDAADEFPPDTRHHLGFFLSALMSFIVSGIATLRNAGPVDDFVSLWINAWLPSWFIAFPVVLVVAPAARRLVGMLVKAPSVQVR